MRQRILIIDNEFNHALHEVFIKSLANKYVVENINSILFAETITLRRNFFNAVVVELALPSNGLLYDKEESENGTKTGFVFWSRTLKGLNMPTIIWSQDSQNIAIPYLPGKLAFLQKDESNPNHLLEAVDALLKKN